MLLPVQATNTSPNQKNRGRLYTGARGGFAPSNKWPAPSTQTFISEEIRWKKAQIKYKPPLISLWHVSSHALQSEIASPAPISIQSLLVCKWAKMHPQGFLGAFLKSQAPSRNCPLHLTDRKQLSCLRQVKVKFAWCCRVEWRERIVRWREIDIFMLLANKEKSYKLFCLLSVVLQISLRSCNAWCFCFIRLPFSFVNTDCDESFLWVQMYLRIRPSSKNNYYVVGC